MALSKICEFYLRGECRYGVQCWNSHEGKTHREHESIEFARAQEMMRITSRNCMLRQLAKVSVKAAQGDQISAYKMNQFIKTLREQHGYEGPYPHMVTVPTGILSAQLEVHDHSASPAQSTSTTSTNVSIAQVQVHDHCASPAQSTSTTSTDALIAQVQVQDLCARPSQSTSTSTNGTNALTTQVQAQELQLQLEASMRPILKQPDNSKIAIEMVANELSVAMKTGNGNSKKETASNFYALHQKKMKESTENNGSVWDDILLSAIDSDLLCNICFEIFIKPTVLNCSHTFCESCIYIWTDRVIACPICRVEVQSKSYCLTLESFIEKIVEHLPKEIKDKREVAIKDRNNIKIERPHRLNRRSTRTFNAQVLVDESELFRMNLHDTVVSTGGVNPLMSYIGDAEEYTFNRRITRPYNSSTRH